ncbi:molybdenum cofactor guanylyltransferase [Roseateles sp. DAIF2]|uniref:molybdenum cofactor guanylyltransferase MobA n=1 Tax=Roseateles sp. DAIF2 TaxID=2714952 RepID=UPI0018A30F9D|nr:molybdenum cofactor guanylyltransferase MobA [Roseateles sp. DAIF2]QPF74752.1 molybdenum cofactor guanylyltransferase [Roseateles sp. DAIF2]
MPPSRAQITGLLLAGGRGSRMGGRDKGLVPYRGRPLAAWALERLAPQVGPLLISANRNLAQYRVLGQALGAPVLEDADAERFAGPLAGLLSGLHACGSDWLLSVPCDSPLLPADLAERLAAGLGGAALAVALDAEGRPHPTFCLLRRELAPALADYLASGGRRVMAWQQAQGAALVPFDRPQHAHAFANANDPDELARLEAHTHHHV